MTNQTATLMLRNQKNTKALESAEKRLKQEEAKKINLKLDLEVQRGRLSVQQALVLGMVVANLTHNPDGQFAQTLISLIQGEF